LIVEISKKQLEKALSTVSPFLDKKNSDSAVSNYLLQAVGDDLIIKATDVTSGLSVKVSEDVIIEREGETTADGKKFLSIVKGLKNDKTITLEIQDEDLLVKQGRSRFKIKTMDSDDFIKFPLKDGKSSITFNSEILHSAFKRILPAVDPNNPKYELNGGLIDIQGGQVNFVATDTKRLAVVQEKIEIAGIDELQLILPKHSLTEITKLFFGDITLFYDEEFIIIKSDDTFFFSKLIGGTYPNYKKILPTEINYEFKLPKDEVVDAIKLVSNVNSEVKFTITNKTFKMETLVDGTLNAEAETEFEFNSSLSEGDEVKIGLNSRYLQDFISLIDDSSFKLSINQPERPFLVESENFKTVIMPISIG